MHLKNLLMSGFNFDELSLAMEFKFRILNAIMLIAAIFSLLFAVLSDLGINDLGPIHSKVDYLYAVLSVVLMLLLRRSRSYYVPVATLFILLSFATFVSALLLVVNDEFRIIWFYFAIFVTYIMLGSTAGMAITLLTLFTILFCNSVADLQMNSNTLYTAVLGLFVGSLLSRIYTVQMGRFEALLETKNRELANSVAGLDAALVQAREASRTKTLFLANMSHEIRTPMNGVLGMVQVMQGTALDEQQQHYLETIERSGRTLLMLIDDLLDISKIEAGKLTLQPAPFDTFSWVIDIQIITEPLFEQGQVAFISEVSEELPKRLHGDAARLLQVLVNLISNAAKFTREGEVRLNVGGRPTSAGHYCLQVEVIDSGIGMPADKLSTIFDAFQQVSPERITNKGVGLGLAISKRLVDAMGGSLTVSSVEGQGSRFRMEVELPLAAEPEAVAAKIDLGAAPVFRVLLVDDDPINRLAVGSLLRQQGYPVVEAENGRIALERMQEQRFDVVLMDVHMPEMDGVEATRQIRASADAQIAATAIIGLTASVMSNEQQSYLDAGMDAVAEKPVVRESLLRMIARCVSDRAGQPGAGA
jgi:signal transduction histidine kinase/CheY-like chemotaxis protein